MREREGESERERESRMKIDSAFRSAAITEKSVRLRATSEPAPDEIDLTVSSIRRLLSNVPPSQVFASDDCSGNVAPASRQRQILRVWRAFLRGFAVRTYLNVRGPARSIRQTNLPV